MSDDSIMGSLNLLSQSYEERPRRKRDKLTASERIFIWERPKKYGRTCNVCHERITKLSDLELDHIRAFSKGGKKLALAHKQCNRMKGNKRLGYVQTRMAIKTNSNKAKKRNRRSNYTYETDIFGNRTRVRKSNNSDYGILGNLGNY